MKRRILCLLGAVAIVAPGLIATPSSADHRGRVLVVRRPRRHFRYYHGRPHFRRHFDDDDGFSVGNLLLGAAAGYGAYRLYDSSRHRRDCDDDDDD